MKYINEDGLKESNKILAQEPDLKKSEPKQTWKSLGPLTVPEILLINDISLQEDITIGEKKYANGDYFRG